MSVSFPQIQVGDPIRHEGLAVFPLFADQGHDVEYELSDEAINKGTVTVEEVSESGSVPDLSVENTGDVRVLFLEGEELIGAKQNRILNTSVLVAAHTKSRIPVSCVEAGRWGYKSRQFGSSGTHSPSKLRRVLKASVSKSVTARRGHRSDQRGVWDEVARQQKALGAYSGTSAMADTFDAFRDQLREFRDKLGKIEGAVGAAIAVGGRVVTVDLFDKPRTCERVWQRLISGAILDAVELGQAERQVDRVEVERVVTSFGSLPWQRSEPVSDGEEFRAESPSGDHASALAFDGTLVHGSLVCAAQS
jgi:hypothetical protein